MRRRVSARLAFGHTPARPCGRKATPSSIRYTILLRERRRHSAGSASASIASAALSDGSRQGDNAFRADRHRGVHRGRRRLIGRRSGGASRATPRRLRPAPRSRTAPAGGRRARVPGRHAPGPPLRPARRYPRPGGCGSRSGRVPGVEGDRPALSADLHGHVHRVARWVLRLHCLVRRCHRLLSSSCGVNTLGHRAIAPMPYGVSGFVLGQRTPPGGRTGLDWGGMERRWRRGVLATNRTVRFCST